MNTSHDKDDIGMAIMAVICFIIVLLFFINGGTLATPYN